MVHAAHGIAGDGVFIKEFQTYKEFGTQINTLVFGFLARHQGTRPFMDAIIGPKFNTLSSFAIEDVTGGNPPPGTRPVPKDDIEMPHGVSTPIVVAHAKMRNLPARIARHFSAYLNEAGVSTDVASEHLEADADKLTSMYMGKNLSVKVGGKIATFRNGGEILSTLFNLTALGQYAQPRPDAARHHLVQTVGNAQDAFDSLIAFTELLQKNFVPGSGENDVKTFEDLHWKYDLGPVNQQFRKNAEHFHRARHYVFLTTSAKDTSILPLFYWKEPRPKEYEPLAINNAEEAASVMLALGEHIQQSARGLPPHPIAQQLMDDAQRVADRKATVAECLDADALHALDKRFPYIERDMGSPSKYAAAVAGLKDYIQKELPLDAPTQHRWTSRTGAGEYTGRQ